MSKFCDVDFVLTFKVPVTGVYVPECREEAEAVVEYWLTEKGLDWCMREYGVADSGYSVRPGYVYGEDVAL